MDEQQRKLAEEVLSTEEERPSFAKMLYFGELDVSRAFPFPISHEQQETDDLIAKLKSFADKEIDADAIDRNAEIPSSVVKGLADLGILGMTIPKEYGGLGMSQTAYCKVMETLAGYCCSTALYVNVHQSIGLKSVLLFGTEEQKKTWLKPLARGDFTAAFSLTEPNAGSDAGGIETTAEFDPAKNCYLINGLKQWITNGGIAKILTVMAKTPVETSSGTEQKVTAFLVTPDMPGFKVRNKALEKVGMRGTWTANLAFENCEVPAENILGKKGKGLRVALTVLDYGRITFGSNCTGMTRYLVKRAYEHANTRIQFGRPLASFPLVKKKLAKMAANLYAMDATTYLTAGLLDAGDREIMLEAAILKVFASDASWEILYDTMQIFGGRSFFTDQPFERLMRDARLNMIGEGSNEVLQVFIAAVGLRDVGMELKEGMEALKSPFGNFGAIWKMLQQVSGRVTAPTVPIESKELKSEANRLGSAIRNFGLTVMSVLSKYREEVVEKQFVCDRIATAVTSLYTTAAVISKCDSELQSGNQENLSVAKLYCTLAMDRFDQAMKSMSKNRDAELEAVSDEVSQKR
ncbi:MAG: putative acyl-CoA dehydrogenase FadE10 [Chlamydiae bacterium]|nr:putative acyl-CoA dehydrogenase FadE10 [Chlamydiota bacterium]